ncbi:hypothetical protein EDD86DRAFT_273720 [Gorgonomyces haynaldii]|nr:hypothetical protein EDD86DRAFT_273720 [Gorgonomyces haynaldii]
MIAAEVMNLSELFQQHKLTSSRESAKLSQTLQKQFNPQAQLLVFPTGAQFKGLIQLEDFHRTYARQSHLILEDQILNRSVGESSVVEESRLVLSHNEQIDWLLPGVKATKKEITVSLVTIVDFDQEGLIVSKRLYWDQASILRQIGVLPRSLYCKANNSEVVLPIADNLQKTQQVVQKEVKKYETAIPQGDEPKPSPRKQPTKESGMAGLPSSKGFAVTDSLGAEHLSRPSSRVLAPPGGISNIFSDEPVQTRPSSRVLSRPGGQSNIFSDEPLPVRKIQVDPSRFESHFKPGEEAEVIAAPNKRDPNTESKEQTHHSTRRSFGGKSNESHFSLAYEEPVNQPKQRRNPNTQSDETQQRPSSRVLQRPGGQTSIHLG